MAFIAKKPVRFDRDSRIGEKISDAGMDVRRERELLFMGLTAKTRKTRKAGEKT